MDQTDKEINALHQFFDIRGREFDPQLLNLRCAEPADLAYAGQGYQITTGRAETASRTTNTYGTLARNAERWQGGHPGSDMLASIFLLDILRKKALRSDRNIILVINVILPHPFGVNEFSKGLRAFSRRNLRLLSVWKEVWCVFISSKKTVRIYPWPRRRSRRIL
jgi:hypothetical protein